MKFIPKVAVLVSVAVVALCGIESYRYLGQVMLLMEVQMRIADTERAIAESEKFLKEHDAWRKSRENHAPRIEVAQKLFKCVGESNRCSRVRNANPDDSNGHVKDTISNPKER